MGHARNHRAVHIGRPDRVGREWMIVAMITAA
jgi:hypothetical protein